jgi:predicted Zn-dependent protease
MVACPACGNEIEAGRALCRCGADLSVLQRLDAVADAWYNRAMRAVAAGQAGEALAWISACCAARPTDAAARLVQARLWGQLGHPAEGLQALAQARDGDPDLPGLDATEQALRELDGAAVQD